MIILGAATKDRNDMGQEGFIVYLILICMAYDLTVFLFERGDNYAEIFHILLYSSLL